jgi:hypothetical protein
MGRGVRRFRQGAVVVAVVLIVGVSVPIAIGAAGGPSAAARAFNGAAAATPKLDHFECYTAASTTNSTMRASFTAKPHAAQLKNRFAQGGFQVSLGKVQMQCSPAQQTVVSTGHAATTAITNANARLVCWAVASKGLKLPGSLGLSNQFGTGVVEPTAARSLCLPSWRNGATPLAFPATSAPSNLDSYACYSVMHPAGTASFKLPSQVSLQDQFGSVKTKVGAPNVVCLPTIRSTKAGWTKAVNTTNYSVCFALPAPAAAARTAYDKNQFGTGAVKVSHDTELCVPSVKSAVTTTTTTSPTSPPPAGSHWTPSSSAPISWYWQLQGTVTTSEPAQVYDIDGFNTSAATVSALHAAHKLVICYIDVGTSEDFRSDFASFPASVQGQTNGWPGEKWLDIRQLSVLEPIMTARMQMCVNKGFDALEPDNIDGYTNSTGFPLTAQDQLTYNTWIANEAHALGLSVGLKNDVDQTTALQPYFDWALNEQCNEYSECGTENAFTGANKAVFNAEYSGGSSFCAADVSDHINGVLFNLELDGSTYQPCTGSW